MRGTLVTLPPGDGPVEARELDRPLALGELHTAVGGYVEVVPHFDTIAYAGTVMNCVAFCDEDGKRKQLPLNDRANNFWTRALDRNGWRARMRPDQLVGPVVVLFGDREFMSEL